MPLDEASAKIRTGGPEDGDTPDAELDVWAGHIPLVVAALDPIPDPTLREGIELPGYARVLPAPGSHPPAADGPMGGTSKHPDFDTVVMKFGGSSVADPEKIRLVARRFVDARRDGLRVVGTVSAMGKTTDTLISLAEEVSDQPHPRELDMLLSTGERIACALVAMAINDLGEEAVSLTGSQAGILTDNAHNKAKIREIRADRVRAALDDGKIVLVAGFQGFSRDTMDVTTLGRGGTDATAVALAAALGAACEIYSDVPGVFTADPRIVPDARKLPVISYEEMLEMSASGAQVLMLRAVELARNHGVRIHARSTFSDEEGTWVQEGGTMEQPIVSAVTQSEHDVVFTLTGIPDRPGVAAMIFDVVAAAHANVDTIIQNVVHGNAEMSFSVPAEDVAATRGGAREHQGGARRLHDRGESRPRQGVAHRSRHAVAPGGRREDVPHPRRQRDQPPDDLDVTDQDLVHDRAGGDPQRGPRPAQRLRAGERADHRGLELAERCRWREADAARRRNQQAMNLSDRTVDALIAGAIGIVVVVAVRWALAYLSARYEQRLAGKDPGGAARRRTTIGFLRKVIVAIVASIAIWNVLSLYDATSEIGKALLASSAVLALFVGLAFSTPLSNLGSGLLVVFSQPLRLGDRVTVAEQTGFVEEMSLLYTTLVTDDARRVFIPNNQLTASTIVNRTIRDPRRAVSATFPVRLGAPIGRAREALTDRQPPPRHAGPCAAGARRRSDRECRLADHNGVRVTRCRCRAAGKRAPRGGSGGARREGFLPTSDAAAA